MAIEIFLKCSKCKKTLGAFTLYDPTRRFPDMFMMCSCGGYCDITHADVMYNPSIEKQTVCDRCGFPMDEQGCTYDTAHEQGEIGR